jgi:uncharacterized phiE125 gp8 family phage protein
MSHFSLTLVTSPAVEPILIGDVRDALRLGEHDEVPLLERYITSARQQVENDTQRKLVTQTWDVSIDYWPCGDVPLVLPIAPIQSVTSITAYDEDGTGTVWSTDNYSVDVASKPPRIYLKSGMSWPSDRRTYVAGVIRVVAGYGDSGSSVPMALRTAIEYLVAHRFENREPVIVGTNALPLPIGYADLIEPYWVGILP